MSVGVDEVREEAARRTVERAVRIAQEAEAAGWYGARALFVRELRRFWGMAGQTLVSPVVTTMLYFLVFGYSLGDRLKEVQGVPYIDFLVPGLVMLATINNAFINAAFSLFIAKIHGMIVDILVTPLTHMQMMCGYVGASVVRAMLVGGIIWVVAMGMGASAWHNVPLVLVCMALTATAMAFVGLTVAILAEDFDHVNLIPNFLITPLTFLGGVFYSIEMLPEPWGVVSRFNPVLYMVNALRYAMTGVSDVPWWQGLTALLLLNAAFGGVTWWLLKTGYKLRV
jgi:ABC-2 type transport system permease protein